MTAFEASYAGPQTTELMERYSAWCTGNADRNKNCLVCLKSVREEPKSLLCATCPRVMHFTCLNTKVAHAGHRMHCPLCIKHRWHLIQPVTPRQIDIYSADSYRMKRIRRYYLWHRYNCEHIEAWQKLQDDGSLESDQNLLIDMGVAEVKTKQHQSSPVGGDGASGDGPEEHDDPESQNQFPHDDNSTHQDQSQSGETAEYYNPDVSQLEADRASEASGITANSHSAKEGQHELARSAVSSRAASSREESNRTHQADKIATSSRSRPDSEAASSVRGGSSSSYVSSKPKTSVVSSALESRPTEVSYEASSTTSGLRVSGMSGSSVRTSRIPLHLSSLKQQPM